MHCQEDQFSSATQSCLTLCNPMNRSTPGLPVHHRIPELLKLTSIQSVMPSSHLILLLPPIPPSIRVFSNESTVCMRCPKYWSFSFSIIPSKEHPGLIFLTVHKEQWSRVYGLRKLSYADGYKEGLSHSPTCIVGCVFIRDFRPRSL